MLSGDDTGRVVLWDTRGMVQVATVNGNGQPITSMCSGTADYIFAGFATGVVIVMGLQSRHVEASITAHGSAVAALAFDPLRQLVVAMFCFVCFFSAGSASPNTPLLFCSARLSVG